MLNANITKIDNRWVLYDDSKMPEPDPAFFNYSQLLDKGLVTGTADGRGETCFFRSGTQTWALRHYMRGGLVAKLFKDQYFGIRLKNTRAWREWTLLHQMSELGLPVPIPVAASVIKKGLFYRADLISEYIESTQTLADILMERSLESSDWQAIGECIRRFHDQAVYHSDLNAKNILLNDKQEIFLIDFDQCGFRAGENWKKNNLLRLRRSLDKFSHKTENFHFSEPDWQALISGYEKIE